MVTITILYPVKEGGRFDADYYVNTHIPMSIALFGGELKGVTVSIGKKAADGSHNYEAICQMLFESEEAFMTRFNEISCDLVADMPAYTNIDIIFQVSDAAIVKQKILTGD